MKPLMKNIKDHKIKPHKMCYRVTHTLPTNGVNTRVGHDNCKLDSYQILG